MIAAGGRAEIVQTGTRDGLTALPPVIRPQERKPTAPGMAGAAVALNVLNVLMDATIRARMQSRSKREPRVGMETTTRPSPRVETDVAIAVIAAKEPVLPRYLSKASMKRVLWTPCLASQWTDPPAATTSRVRAAGAAAVAGEEAVTVVRPATAPQGPRSLPSQ